MTHTPDESEDKSYSLDSKSRSTRLNKELLRTSELHYQHGPDSLPTAAEFLDPKTLDPTSQLVLNYYNRS